VLDDPAIELVAIESADVDRNLDYAEQCVPAGKFVHLEKPPGADLARLRSLFAEAAKRKRVVQMGYQPEYSACKAPTARSARCS
jgi:predicted dehydrogenase